MAVPARMYISRGAAGLLPTRGFFGGQGVDFSARNRRVTFSLGGLVLPFCFSVLLELLHVLRVLNSSTDEGTRGSVGLQRLYSWPSVIGRVLQSPQKPYGSASMCLKIAYPEFSWALDVLQMVRFGWPHLPFIVLSIFLWPIFPWPLPWSNVNRETHGNTTTQKARPH